jgi:hypothetical protein
VKTVLPRALSPKADEVNSTPHNELRRMTERQKTRFLELLIGGSSQHRAASQLGIPRLLVVREAQLDEQFAKDLELALEARVDAIEELAIEFATQGTEKGVYHMGVLVDTERQYGPHALLQFLLKANRPEKYKERTEQTLNVNPAGPPPTVRDDRDAQRLLSKVRQQLLPVIEAQFTEVKPDDGSDLI